MLAAVFIIQQLFDRRRIQCEWAENLFLGLVTHLQQNPATRLDWGDLANTEELEKLLISHPFEPVRITP